MSTSSDAQGLGFKRKEGSQCPGKFIAYGKSLRSLVGAATGIVIGKEVVLQRALWGKTAKAGGVRDG